MQLCKQKDGVDRSDTTPLAGQDMHHLKRIRRVEEGKTHLVQTGKDCTKMGLPKNLPEMPKTEVPAMD